MDTLRIKNISVTASFPSVDDYLAIDGSLFGTRKWSAYNLSNNSLQTNSIQLNMATAPGSVAKGQLSWNLADGTLDIGMGYDGVIQQVGQELFFPTVKAASTITNGQVVRMSGTNGNSGNILVVPAIADGSVPREYVCGIATMDIANGENGYIVPFGKVRGIRTNGNASGETWVDGQVLYVSPSVPGQLTKYPPELPNIAIEVAAVVNAHANNGTLMVRCWPISSSATFQSVQTANLHIYNIPQYADNAAALAGGLTTGHLYRTGDVVKIVNAGGGGAGGSNVTISDNPPTLPSNGDLWWDSTIGQLRIYYNDGNTAQWVDAISPR